MENLKTLRVDEFVDLTASDSPAPGGGSIAALSAATAAALLSMVAKLTIKSKKYEAVHDEMKEIEDVVAPYVERFTEAIDRDANSFNAVMDAFKLPKETDEEKKARSAKIQEGYKHAIEVPLSLAREVVKLYEPAEKLANDGNVNAITDVSVALLNIEAAARGALLNVRINLNSLKDEALKEEINTQIKEVLEAIEKNQSRILEIADKKL